MAKDWYRCETWTDETQAHFELRLKRARPDNRAQYLRIQACSLRETGDPRYLPAARELLRRAIEDDSAPGLFMAWAVVEMAKNHEAANQWEDAGLWFDRAIQLDRQNPRLGLNAELDLGWMVAIHEIAPRYQTSLALLRSRPEEWMFPVADFKRLAAIAIIEAAIGDFESSRRNAAEALRHAAKTRSGAAKHPKLGLVDDRYGLILKRLAMLSA